MHALQRMVIGDMINLQKMLYTVGAENVHWRAGKCLRKKGYFSNKLTKYLHGFSLNHTFEVY